MFILQGAGVKHFRLDILCSLYLCLLIFISCIIVNGNFLHLNESKIEPDVVQDDQDHQSDIPREEDMSNVEYNEDQEDHEEVKQRHRRQAPMIIPLAGVVQQHQGNAMYDGSVSLKVVHPEPSERQTGYQRYASDQVISREDMARARLRLAPLQEQKVENRPKLQMQGQQYLYQRQQAQNFAGAPFQQQQQWPQYQQPWPQHQQPQQNPVYPQSQPQQNPYPQPQWNPQQKFQWNPRQPPQWNPQQPLRNPLFPQPRLNLQQQPQQWNQNQQQEQQNPLFPQPQWNLQQQPQQWNQAQQQPQWNQAQQQPQWNQAQQQQWYQAQQQQWNQAHQLFGLQQEGISNAEYNEDQEDHGEVKQRHRREAPMIVPLAGVVHQQQGYDGSVSLKVMHPEPAGSNNQLVDQQNGYSNQVVSREDRARERLGLGPLRETPIEFRPLRQGQKQNAPMQGQQYQRQQPPNFAGAPFQQQQRNLYQQWKPGYQQPQQNPLFPKPQWNPQQVPQWPPQKKQPQMNPFYQQPMRNFAQRPVKPPQLPLINAPLGQQQQNYNFQQQQGINRQQGLRAGLQQQQLHLNQGAAAVQQHQMPLKDLAEQNVVESEVPAGNPKGNDAGVIRPKIGIQETGKTGVVGKPGGAPIADLKPAQKKAPRRKPNSRYDRYKQRTKYNRVMVEDEIEFKYWHPENDQVFIMCPKNAFIAEIVFQFDVTTEKPKSPKWFTVKDKITKGLSPETKETVKYPREKPMRKSGDGIKNDDLSRFNDGFNEIIAQQSPLSQTGCDPILYCLGHQTCIFKILSEFCAVRATKTVKSLFMNVKCVKDALLSRYMDNESDMEVIKEEMQQVMNIRWADEASTPEWTVIELNKVDEEEIYGVSCPPVKDVYKHG